MHYVSLLGSHFGLQLVTSCHQAFDTSNQHLSPFGFDFVNMEPLGELRKIHIGSKKDVLAIFYIFQETSPKVGAIIYT